MPFLGSSPSFGILETDLRLRIKATTSSFLSSGINFIVIEFSLISPRVSISSWWFFRGIVVLFMSVIWFSRESLSGCKFMIFLISFMNKKAAEGLCLGIGDVCPTEFSLMEGGDHLRVRVILDITKPLFRGCKITLEGGNLGWVSFKYERLSSICYWCGCLTHGDKDYDLWINSEGTLMVDD